MGTPLLLSSLGSCTEKRNSHHQKLINAAPAPCGPSSCWNSNDNRTGSREAAVLVLRSTFTGGDSCTLTRIRGALLPASWRRRRIGSPGLCGSMAWHV